MVKPLNILITGGAGFIGSHLVERLLSDGHHIIVFDNFDTFYSPSIKRQNISHHIGNSAFKLIEGDLRNLDNLRSAMTAGPFDAVIHLAGLAGVRPSLERPLDYFEVNVSGTQRLIDCLINNSFKGRFVFGSSSSVYGERSGEAFLESDQVDRPLSPYAASKAAAELLCYSAHHTQGLDVVCLRFFTVFGPRQRPDLAIHKFCRLIDSGKPIEIYGDGTALRDYTYVADIVEGITQAMLCPLSGYEIINLGRGNPVKLSDMVQQIEQSLGKKANIIYCPRISGDMPYTFASIDKARQLLGYTPATNFAQGIKNFVEWYCANKSKCCT